MQPTSSPRAAIARAREAAEAAVSDAMPSFKANTTTTAFAMVNALHKAQSLLEQLKGIEDALVALGPSLPNAEAARFASFAENVARVIGETAIALKLLQTGA